MNIDEFTAIVGDGTGPVIEVKPCGACTWAAAKRAPDEAFVACLATVAVAGPAFIAEHMCPEHQALLRRMVVNIRDKTSRNT